MRNSQSSSRWTLALAAAFLLLSIGSADPHAAETELGPPDGVYVATLNFPAVLALPQTIAVSIKSNGEYELRAEYREREGHAQEGTWKWDARKQEFLLTPAADADSAEFVFGIRRLRVDSYHSNTLQWMPASETGAGLSGAIEYIRFKRKAD